MNKLTKRIQVVLTVLSLSAGSLLVAAPVASAAGSFYYPSGPQLNVPISTITNGGWTLCWSGLYGQQELLSNLTNNCTKKYLMEVGGAVGASTYLLAAAGERTAVFAPTGSNQVTFNNGTYWYFNTSASMGFSPSPTISQSSADVYATNDNYRLSWHTRTCGVGKICGGWRIGSIIGLNNDNSYIRAIYQSDDISVSSAPTSVTATSTGATTADVSFTAPASNGGAAITSYTATSSPGGITGTISQATSGTIAMTGLTAGTAYTFTVRATNSAGTSAASSPSSSTTTVGVPSAPTSVVATATGKRSATVSYAAPASDGGSAITSYTATSSPGGITRTINQATGGTFNFDGLQPATAYTFAVTATNAIGTSAATVSNSVTTTALVVASLATLSFKDDGSGTGGQISWSGKNIDSVLYTGDKSIYPGALNYGAFSPGWGGRLVNLTPKTTYTVSIFAISGDGVGESLSLTFTTGAGAIVDAKTLLPAAKDLAYWSTWANANTYYEGEAGRMMTLMSKFNALTTAPTHSYFKLPTSRVSTVIAKSLTPESCAVYPNGDVTMKSSNTCTISYTVSGLSKAPATMTKDFAYVAKKVLTNAGMRVEVKTNDSTR